MTVPPIQQIRPTAASRAMRVPVLLDAVIGLLTVVALPLAIVAIPNTISVVSALLPSDVSPLAMTRAYGLALPAMLLTVPLAAVGARLTRPAPILLSGLALLAAADAAGGFAGSTLMVAILRVAHGVGAGMLIPATLVAVWERPSRRILLPLWAGALAASLVGAQAMALWPLDDVTAWQVTLQPYPMLTGVALGLGAAYLVLRLLSTDDAASARPADGEIGRLALTAVPAAGIGALAIGTTFDWPSGLVIGAAAIAVAALLGLSLAATFDGTAGRTLALTSVCVGLALLPTVAQATYVELRGLGGPGLSGLTIPFWLAAVVAVGAAWLASRTPQESAARLNGAGLVAVVAGLSGIRLMVPSTGGTLLVIPFALLAAGAAVALVSALRQAGIGTTLFGLSLCFPAVLAGFLLGTGIQVTKLRAIGSSGNVTRQALVDGFVGALHLWALIGGFLVVLVLVLMGILARRAAIVPAMAGPAAAEAEAGPEDVVVVVPADEFEAEDVPPLRDLAEFEASLDAADPGESGGK
ncbi:hypothetical protein J5X84_44665 [Streptosporangiaceae bacterium NEAU-GS5]|nr:hypothetical protein [Streptosporangiaceae bacterium NEAU-GS5]